MPSEAEQRSVPPLYERVRIVLVARIASGQWKPGQLLPSEMELARTFRVHQGTVRKALEALVRENLVVRRQGRGTFVVEHTPTDVHFRFFRLRDERGRPIQPGSTAVRARVRCAKPEEARRLALSATARVIAIARLRTRDGVPFIDERIVLPAKWFPKLLDAGPLPNTLYDTFQARYGITVASIEEAVTSIASNAATARRLGIVEGAPLLRIDRIALDLDGRRVEWRVSDCHLDGASYLAPLR
jgi:GntR family transcriptional regulator